jgi:dienelactone hydrolase
VRIALACLLCAVATAPAPVAAARFRVQVLRLVDRTRTIRLPDGRLTPRTLVTVVRYPTSGSRRPLIVFAHGFALTPGTYDRLLDAWARAGYVVAAPVFPLENANAPGGPSRADLVNEPRDLSFVVTRLLAVGPAVDRSRIAVAGQSDGGVAALAVAYDRRVRDRRVRAAVVLSGAPPAGMGSFPRRGPALLAVQGTADPYNAPATTAAYFQAAHRPKFLLWLLGASHRPPYTTEEPQLGIVERATIAFLDHYLKRRPLLAFDRAARQPGTTRLVADP